MTRATKPGRVNLPRPTKRARARTSLVINMHPDQLAELRARATSREMSLTAYLGALLDSDADDVAPERRRFFSWGELTSPASMLAAGVHRGHEVRDRKAAREVARAIGAPLADDDCAFCDQQPCECALGLRVETTLEARQRYRCGTSGSVVQVFEPDDHFVRLYRVHFDDPAIGDVDLCGAYLVREQEATG